MKNLFTDKNYMPFIGRVTTLLMLGLIAANSLFVTVPSFARSSRLKSSLPAAENGFNVFCSFYYNDPSDSPPDPTAATDTQDCKRLSSSFATSIANYLGTTPSENLSQWPTQSLSALATQSKLGSITSMNLLNTMIFQSNTQLNNFISQDNAFLPTLWDYNTVDDKMPSGSTLNDNTPNDSNSNSCTLVTNGSTNLLLDGKLSVYGTLDDALGIDLSDPNYRSSRYSLNCNASSGNSTPSSCTLVTNGSINLFLDGKLSVYGTLDDALGIDLSKSNYQSSRYSLNCSTTDKSPFPSNLANGASVSPQFTANTTKCPNDSDSLDSGDYTLSVGNAPESCDTVSWSGWPASQTCTFTMSALPQTITLLFIQNGNQVDQQSTTANQPFTITPSSPVDRIELDLSQVQKAGDTTLGAISYSNCH